jgi:hypothetical protein
MEGCNSNPTIGRKIRDYTAACSLTALFYFLLPPAILEDIGRIYVRNVVRNPDILGGLTKGYKENLENLRKIRL